MSTLELELGKTWKRYHNNRREPNFNQIVEGLHKEVMQKIELVMSSMNQLVVLEAKANLKKTWDDLFSLVEFSHRDKELTKD